MFSKILIANRGEIACRVIKTARRLGIATVAVYSEADKNALHVEMADEAVLIGPAPSAESYLVASRLVEACQATGADAVHPGYGFLSENAAFAEALAAAGVTFIGPPVGAIEAMGDKITSKRIAEEAGVSTIPGYTDVVQGADHAVELSQSIGYPIMLKASAGGGGKGMRVVRDDAECRDAFVRASSEARSSFGDDRVFLERFIEQPRHIEIQVLADAHGNVVHLGERECSIQRRHQKVIEEAPSPFLDEATREAMGEQACRLARAVDYRSAGTVEFVVDPQRHFYFLEMNTRLQVEHPVTEFVTGLDLVEQMIRVAAGESLGFSQADVKLSGWAVESRIYAEDPSRDFVPSTGRISTYRPPGGSGVVRVDTGVFEGGEVSMFYDPMIAKLVTYGASRPEAVTRMLHAIDAFEIEGVATNLTFLSALLAHPRFQAGDLSTAFIDDEFADGFDPGEADAETVTRLAAMAVAVHIGERRLAGSLSGQVDGYRPRVDGDWTVLLGSRSLDATCTMAAGGLRVTLDGGEHEVHSVWTPGEVRFDGQIDGEDFIAKIHPAPPGFSITHGEHRVSCRVMTRRAGELQRLMIEKVPPDFSKFLLSPMPGLLSQVLVSVGESVDAGQDLAVVEAMKMENTLRADRPRVVKEVLAQPGDSLSVDQPILAFE